MTDPPVPAAESVRCQDCGESALRYDAYEVRTPQEVADGCSHTETFWLCTNCWDRMVSAATFAIVRGAF